ncbi:hypothetical protein [Nonomuraea jabiensis]|uniref:Uncharacterized protein n=1 Tax=Nonomuraea jabiensis TaxID=882448 RepID=A0A7W9LBE9_9ACTN|nr:hypothetical protein [Nonomuraea jabiensis]MBB5777625.1 hypothetical protein [Nonomuraea jabiensis]
MTDLIERIEDTIKVDAYQFMLMDNDGSANRPASALAIEDLGAQLKNPDVWFVATANIAIVKSNVADWHVADVALELWDGHPPADDKGWIKSVTTQMYCSSGRMLLVQTLGRPSRKSLNLRAADRTWSVRCSLGPGKGERYIEDGPPQGLESYRLQFWPSL